MGGDFPYPRSPQRDAKTPSSNRVAYQQYLGATRLGRGRGEGAAGGEPPAAPPSTPPKKTGCQLSPWALRAAQRQVPPREADRARVLLVARRPLAPAGDPPASGRFGALAEVPEVLWALLRQGELHPRLRPWRAPRGRQRRQGRARRHHRAVAVAPPSAPPRPVGEVEARGAFVQLGASIRGVPQLEGRLKGLHGPSEGGARGGAAGAPRAQREGARRGGWMLHLSGRRRKRRGWGEGEAEREGWRRGGGEGVVK